MKHLDNRSDFSSDEEFANFRSLILGNCKSKKYFRSASALTNTYGRQSTVREIMEREGITHIIDFSGIKYRCMSGEFESFMVQKIREIIVTDEPCILQCDAGKKRTGYVCIILEMLSGTNYGYIVADYLESYKNNNGMNLISEKSKAEQIRINKINSIIQYINADDTDVTKIDLVKVAKKYLLKCGLTNHEISLLQEKLLQ